MTFAVAGILSHFSKTMLVFMMPQIFNFVFSVPQLFKLVPCPRHRMPKCVCSCYTCSHGRFNAASGLLEPSVAVYKPSELSALGRLIIAIAKFVVWDLCCSDS